MNNSIVVCLPTYNEAENINRIVAFILKALPLASILIIDDDSPDGTGRMADMLARQDSRIAVLHRRSKQGLGKAYMEGFSVALHHMSAQYVVQMDADLSHPTEMLPQMIDVAQAGNLVIGSRYVPGGGTRNWNAARRMISRFGAWYARFWLVLPIHDPTGGFKVWSRDLLLAVLNYPIGSGGYAFQVEATYIACRLGARITEIPIWFADRRVGRSKMSLSIAVEAFWRIPLMRIHQHRYAVKSMRPL
jgi:dolichol-phosphate mannosyltransferase